MRLRILLALLRKETLLMSRNPIIPKIIFAMPVMVMLVLPLVADLDVGHVSVVVADNDSSQLSRRIVADIDAAETLEAAAIYDNFKSGMNLVEDGVADVVLTIPPGFAKQLTIGDPRLDLRVNGVNASKGMLSGQYAGASALTTISKWMAEEGLPIDVREDSVVNLYNPTLNFRNYMVPALMVVLLIIICGFLPTLNLVSEKERGTIEAMNVSPVGKSVFVLSKLIPFWVVGILVVSVGMLIGWSVYGLLPAGSVWQIYVAAILFSLVMSGIGVTIANCSSTMLQSIFVMFACIIIFQLMGGLFTPIDSMPGWARAMTYAVPPRYFNEIMRAVYLKGATFSELLSRYAALGGFAVFFCITAAFSYKKRA